MNDLINQQRERIAELEAENKQLRKDLNGEYENAHDVNCEQNELRAKLETAEQRVKELEGEIASRDKTGLPSQRAVNKFAIEQKATGYYDSCIESGMNEGQSSLLADIYAEQLRAKLGGE